MGIPLYVICYFPLFSIFFFIFNFFLIWLILAHHLCLGFILYGTLCASCAWVALLFPLLEKFIYCNLFKYFLRFFLFFFFFFFFRGPYNSNVGEFNVAPEVWDCPRVFLFIYFFYIFLFCGRFPLFYLSLIFQISTLIWSFASVILPLIPSKVFFKFQLLHFSSVCLLFSYFRSC